MLKTKWFSFEEHAPDPGRRIRIRVKRAARQDGHAPRAPTVRTDVTFEKFAAFSDIEWCYRIA